MKKEISIALIALFCCLIAVNCKNEYSSSVIGNPSSLDSPLQDIQWCGENSSNDNMVVLLTQKGSVYRSEDRGASWIKMVDSFARVGVNVKMDLSSNVGIVTQMIASPIDSNEIVFMGSDGINWITADCGVTIQALGINLNLREFMYHPTEKNWMLASSFNNCEKQNNQKDKRKKDTECFKTKDLFFSENKGKSWRVLLKYVVQFGWAHKVNSKLTNVPTSRIIYSKEVGNSGHQVMKGWSMKTHLFYTDDFMKNQIMIVNQGNKFLITESYLFAAQVHSSDSQLVKLMVSQSNQKEYAFTYAEIPEDIHQHSFTILDTKEGQVFLNINHLGANSPMGNIYQSDSTGTRFSLSLEDNVRGRDGQCDFESVNGVEGIFISNIFAPSKKLKGIKQMLQSKNPDTSDEDIPTENTRKKGQAQNSEDVLKESLKSLRDSMVTRITFDKGGMWSLLRAPAKDSIAKQIGCDLNKKCSLHLHSVSSQLSFGPAYSSENSLGLIIATGNTGQFLSHKAGSVNTYLSRDGGLVWEEIRKGSHIYEVADHGSIIVMATDQEPTKNIIFSWDEGRTWNTKQISDTPVMISNIITEPGNTSDKFLVYGSVEGDSDISGIIVLLDFASLHPRDCSGYENPDTSDSDYEYWTPHNPSEFCLLGREVKYVRRKRDAACFNPETFERSYVVRKCECTELDWECDVGFARAKDEGKERTGPCVPIQDYKVDNNPPETCSGSYQVTQGYRRIAGNQCIGGIDHSPIQYPCPMFGFLSQSNLFSNVLILAAMAGAFYLIIQNKEVVITFVATSYLDAYINLGKTYLMRGYTFVTSVVLPQVSNQQQGYFQANQDEENRKSHSLKNQHHQFHDNLIEGHDDDDDDDDEEQSDAVQQQITSSQAPQNNSNKNNNNSNTPNQTQHKDLLDEHDGEEDPFDPRN
ncbi:hypothetical protein ABPG72_022335 [Tetrahymena utriculariae]